MLRIWLSTFLSYSTCSWTYVWSITFDSQDMGMEHSADSQSNLKILDDSFWNLSFEDGMEIWKIMKISVLVCDVEYGLPFYLTWIRARSPLRIKII